jgi:Tfp pilus assembly protein PilV
MLNEAFSLIEVMVAAAIFFLFTFSILAMVASHLRNLRVIRRMEADAGMVAAQLFKTNRLAEGGASGDFGDICRDFSWATETVEMETNGLWEVQILVNRRGSPQPVDQMRVRVFSPESSASLLGGRGVR